MLSDVSPGSASGGAVVPSADGDLAGATAVRGLLARLLATSTAFRFTSLSTVDGRSIAVAGRVDDVTTARIAAMTSALLGLSETFAKEAVRSRCAYTTITADDGVVVVVRVPTRARLHALSVASDANENLALVLRRTLDAAHALALLVDADPSGAGIG